MIGQFSSSSPGSILCFALSNAASHSSRGVLHALLLRKDSVGNLEVTMRWAMEAGHIAEVTTCRLGKGRLSPLVYRYLSVFDLNPMSAVFDDVTNCDAGFD